MTKLKGAVRSNARHGGTWAKQSTAPLVVNLDTNGSDRSTSHPESDTREEGCPGGYVSSIAGLKDSGKKISPPVAVRTYRVKCD